MASGETVTVGDDEAAETQQGTVAEGGADNGDEAFPPFDSTTFPSQLLWLAITFAALYYLMAKVALPRIAGILENRRDRIASDLDTADRLKGESDEAIAGYDRALAEARDKAFAIAEAARAKARHGAEVKRSAIEADLNQKLASAEERIGEIKAEALREVGGIAAGAAVEIVTALTTIEATRSDTETAVVAVMEERRDHAG